MRVAFAALAAAVLAGGFAAAQTSQTAPAATPRPRPPAAARVTVSATLNG